MMRFIVLFSLFLIDPSHATDTGGNYTKGTPTFDATTNTELALFLQNLTATSNVSQPLPAIIGGELAGSTEFGWFGRTSIVFDLGGGSFLFGSCGGSLIHADIVVSAAHCLIDSLAEFPNVPFSITFHLGANRYDGNDGIKLAVTDYYYRTDYTFPANDIIFYKLSSSTSVPPVSWNTNPSIPSVGDISTAIGFGKTSDGGSGSETLLKVNLAVVACEGAGITCTFTQGKSICQGDSGGPILTSNGVLYGMASFVTGGACTTGPSGFTQSSYFRNDFTSVRLTPRLFFCIPFIPNLTQISSL